MTTVPTTASDPETDDIRLMIRVRAGDDSAFVELIQRHQNRLLNYFARLGVYHDKEDLVQDTFIRLYRNRTRYKPTAKFTTYLYLLARHTWIDHGRKAGRQRRIAEALEAETGGEKQVELADTAGRLDVRAALERLSPKLREAIVLLIYQGLSYQDIAEVVGIPLGTVKSRINSALHLLRRDLNEP